MELTADQLVSYNGKGGMPAYIAYNGNIYDVSELFENGEHRSCMAGNDLTGILEYMPHGAEVLSKFPLVGRIIK